MKLAARCAVSTSTARPVVCGAVALAFAFALNACTCPPCVAAASAPPTCAPETASAAVAAPAASAGQAVAAPAQREVLWDGELVTRGQGWANCDKPAEGCKATFTTALSEGVANTNGLKLQAQGSGWQGGGWNWFGWWPENAGTDASGFHELTFALRLASAAPDKMPKPERTTVALGCSVAKKTSLELPLAGYAADAFDGQWHRVAVPLQDFFGGKGAECDARAVWELKVNVWSDTPVQFELLLDDLALARRW